MGKHRVEDVATPEGFDRDPELVKRFITPVVDSCSSQKFSLTLTSCAGETARCSRRSLFAGDENIDNLHERAGNTNVIHMHGNC